MNMDVSESRQIDKSAAPNAALLARGLDGLDNFLENSAELEHTLDNLIDVADEETAAQAGSLKAKLRALEPSVTMIGQIKAGKTSLVNAMMGSPDLLPADVNPWTTVVTSLHINADRTTEDTRASFEFFDHEEWDRLLDNGGRIGELASRAGADDELEKVKAQIGEMREKTRNRLGKKFEMLLGQKHDYGYFDDDLIQRYVCLGDDIDVDDGLPDTQGRFADITKSANLYLDRPELPIGLCIRDTPGVNDTFMMREQITISAIRDSRICVVVLSAHQALTSMDMALIRLISNVQSREVIIFVNRIDELSDPGNQIPEIRESIVATLKKANAPADIDIIFGSAYWANHALSGTLNDLAEDSAQAMFSWAETALQDSDAPETPEATAWELSGLPELYRALSERIVEGPGGELIDNITNGALNLVNGMRASDQMVSLKMGDADVTPPDREALIAELARVETNALKSLDDQMAALVVDFEQRLDRSHHRFLDRATDSLITHLEANGESAVWHYNPMGLRVLLRSNYLVFGKQATALAKKIYDHSATEFTSVYTKIFSVSVDGFQIEAPNAPNVPPPVALGQTIALDLSGSWWKKWWQRRRGYKTYAEHFYKLIEAETDPIVNDLKVTQVDTIKDAARTELTEFIAVQRRALMNMADKGDLSRDDLSELFGVKAQEDRNRVVEAALVDLNKHAA